MSDLILGSEQENSTKMDKAREIYITMTNDEESRKAIVDEFVKQVGLSKAAANTYYQMIKKNLALMCFVFLELENLPFTSSICVLMLSW